LLKPKLLLVLVLGPSLVLAQLVLLNVGVVEAAEGKVVLEVLMALAVAVVAHISLDGC
jgi:uncharacterized membrane protein